MILFQPLEKLKEYTTRDYHFCVPSSVTGILIGGNPSLDVVRNQGCYSDCFSIWIYFKKPQKKI